MVAEELESLRGRAYNFAGDAVVGVFGLQHTHDDDALRAVRAGLGLVDRVGRLGEEIGLPVPLRIRVGIHTGPVAIGSEASEQGLIYGATVNLAARLQQAADPGTVLVSETSYLLSLSQVQYGPMREVEAKGFEDEARAWPVAALQRGSGRRTIPLVNRKRELRLLQDAFDGARETRRGHLVTLFGEPGIGKSRVVDEFVAGLPDDAKVLMGRASPFEEDVTFGPLAQILLHEMGEAAHAPPEALRARLEEIVLECTPPNEAKQIVERLCIALGIAGEVRDEKRYRVAEIRSGLLALLRGFSGRGPVVLVLEDLQAAQAAMLELVEELVREADGIPLLVICAARYTLLDDRPGWGGGRGNSVNLYLETLSLDDSAQLAREAGEGLDEATAQRIARHAGGNPFFIIETTGMLLHEGKRLPADTGPLPPALLPPTVQAVIAARIDHLSPEGRDLIRKASVFARSTFTLAELGLIADPTGEALGRLEEEELLERDGDPDVWRFSHGMVRDVAYESLPKRERQRLHLLVADGLSGNPQMAARRPRAIAFHLEQAALASLDLNPRDRTLAERAVDALARAGDIAREGPNMKAAEEDYRRALELAGPERTWGLREARILASLGEIRYWLGEFELAVPVLERALKLGDGDLAVRAHASRFLGDIELSVLGDAKRAAELLDDALEAARGLGDPWTLARTLLVAAWAPYFRRDTEGARAMFQEALETARANPEGDRWSEARSLVGLSTLESDGGDEEGSLRLAAEALAIAETSGDRFSLAVAHEAVGGTMRHMMRLADAEEHMDRAVDAFRALGARWELASALTSRGIARRLAGRAQDAVEDLREAYRICRELKERSIITWTAAALARAYVSAGDPGAARRVLEETASVASEETAATEDWLDYADVEILLAEGERDAALERALSILRYERAEGSSKDAAARVWWISQVFGVEAAGGEEEVERARELLERTQMLQPFREAELVTSRSAISEA
jgi:tetratricopeptide (TPR) repeat protein